MSRVLSESSSRGANATGRGPVSPFGGRVVDSTTCRTNDEIATWVREFGSALVTVCPLQSGCPAQNHADHHPYRSKVDTICL